MSKDGIEQTLRKPARKKNGNGMLVGAIVAVVIIGIVIAVVKARAAAAGAANALQYKEASVTVGQVRHTVSEPGVLTPWTEFDVKSRAGGALLRLVVDAGDVVKPGQLLAQIDPTDSLTSYQEADANYNSSVAARDKAQVTYDLQLQQTKNGIETAQAALAAAVANRDAAAAAMASAKTTANNQPGTTAAAIEQAKAGYDQAVKTRAGLDATDPQDQATAKATYDQAVANQVNAQADYQRQVALAAKGFVPTQTVDSSKASLAVYEAQVASAKVKVDTLAAQQLANRENADAKVSQAKAALDAAQKAAVAIQTSSDAYHQAQAAYEQAKTGVLTAQAALDQAIANAKNNAIQKLNIAAAADAVANSEAARKDAKVVLDQTNVRSPSDGVVIQKYLDQGTIITSALGLASTGTSIVQLGDLSRMYVDVTVDETDIASIDVGQVVDVSFDAYPGVPFQGKVTIVNPAAVVLQNVTSVHVRVEIDNSAPTFRLLKPGMNATCNFILQDKEGVVNVPNEAIHEDDSGKYVEVVVEKGKPTPDDPSSFVGVKTKHVPVETGLEGNDVTEITSGLKGGETVVTQTIDPTPASVVAGATGGGGSPFGGGGAGGGRR